MSGPADLAAENWHLLFCVAEVARPSKRPVDTAVLDMACRDDMGTSWCLSRFSLLGRDKACGRALIASGCAWSCGRAIEERARKNGKGEEREMGELEC